MKMKVKCKVCGKITEIEESERESWLFVCYSCKEHVLIKNY